MNFISWYYGQFRWWMDQPGLYRSYIRMYWRLYIWDSNDGGPRFGLMIPTWIASGYFGWWLATVHHVRIL